jgi:hypothetical protein
MKSPNDELVMNDNFFFGSNVDASPKSFSAIKLGANSLNVFIKNLQF